MASTRRVWKLLLAMAVAGAGASLARGDHREEARAAQRALEHAEWRVADASRDAERARAALDCAVADQQAAAARIRDLSLTIASLQTALGDTVALDQALAEAEAAQHAVEQRRQALDAARARLADIQAEIARLRAAAQATFESSPAFIQTQQALEQAQKRLDDVTAVSLKALQADPRYVELRTRADDLRELVKRLRDTPGADPQELADASAAWMQAESEASRYEAEWLASDLAVREARQALEKVSESRQQLLARFEQELSQDPKLADAMVRRDLEQQAASAIELDLQEAINAQVAADWRARDLQLRYADAQARIPALQAELAEAQLNRANSLAWAAESDLRLAGDRQSRALWEREWAARELRRSIEDIDRRRAEAEARQRLERQRQEQQARERQEREREQRERQQSIDRLRQQREAEFQKRRAEQRAAEERAHAQEQRKAREREARQAQQRQDEQREREQTRDRQREEARRREAETREREAARQREEEARRRDRDQQERRPSWRDPNPNDRGSRYRR
jgi:hypothetical protein